MSESKPIVTETKSLLHPRNRHRSLYDFEQLIKLEPLLAQQTHQSKAGTTSIDFSDETSVKLLNKAILKASYNIQNWDIPEGYLCPPVPGRADHIHYVADLLAADNRGTIPTGPGVRVLDVGAGANLIYPIIGHHEYGWSFTGSETDPIAMDNAIKIVAGNPALAESIVLRRQLNPGHVIKGIIKDDDEFDLVICNPPFYSDLNEAAAANQRKWKNLGQQPKNNTSRNFGGTASELVYPGGEVAFIKTMISESKFLRSKAYWFTSLVSRGENMNKIRTALRAARPERTVTIHMSQGQKSSQIIAWTFLDEKQQKIWRGRKFWDA